MLHVEGTQSQDDSESSREEIHVMVWTKLT